MRTTSPQRQPTWRDEAEDVAARIGAPPIYGPPVAFLFGPWLILGLLLAVPFGAVFALLLVLAVAAVLLAAIAAVLVSPYLLVRHLRAHRARQPEPKPAGARHPLRKRRVGTRRLGSPQPKGVS
ncbi:MAG: hypothetical protein ACJ77M_03800 [Thermoleophilaceae bacterium]